MTDLCVRDEQPHQSIDVGVFQLQREVQDWIAPYTALSEVDLFALSIVIDSEAALDNHSVHVSSTVRKGRHLRVEKHVVATDPAKHLFFKAELRQLPMDAVEQVHLMVVQTLFDQLVFLLPRCCKHLGCCEDLHNNEHCKLENLGTMPELHVVCKQSWNELIDLALHDLLLQGCGYVVFWFAHCVRYPNDSFLDRFYFDLFSGSCVEMIELLVKLLTWLRFLELFISFLKDDPSFCIGFRFLDKVT